MSLRLVIAEKPSVAQAIAHVLGATARKDGYMEGGGYLVSWCVGHLVGLAPPTPTTPGIPSGPMRICLLCRNAGSMPPTRTRKSSWPS